MSAPLPAEALNQLFLEARTHNLWQDKDVSDDILNQVWDLARWGPTSMNCCPARITFIKSPEAKEKLKDCLSEGNIAKTMAAPVTAIIATDMQFFTNMPRLFPPSPVPLICSIKIQSLPKKPQSEIAICKALI